MNDEKRKSFYFKCGTEQDPDRMFEAMEMTVSEHAKNTWTDYESSLDEHGSATDLEGYAVGIKGEKPLTWVQHPWSLDRFIDAAEEYNKLYPNTTKKDEDNYGILNLTDNSLKYHVERLQAVGLNDEDQQKVLKFFIGRLLVDVNISDYLKSSIAFMKNHKQYVDKITGEEMYAGNMSLASYRETGGNFDEDMDKDIDSGGGYIFVKATEIRGKRFWLSSSDFNDRYMEKDGVVESTADMIINSLNCGKRK